MDPIAVVEAKIGSVDRSPSFALKLMFMMDPNSRVMKKVSAFMCGSNVRLSNDMACYNACNGHHQSRVETKLKAWYVVWNRDVNQSHREQYHSMILKCLARINGKARDHYEEVKPVITLSKYGPAGTC